MQSKIILVTGAAGFIGYHLCKSLISKGYRVVGIDDINNYYDVNIKYSRLEILGIKNNKAKEWNVCVQSQKNREFTFIRAKLEDRLK